MKIDSVLFLSTLTAAVFEVAAFLPSKVVSSEYPVASRIENRLDGQSVSSSLSTVLYSDNSKKSKRGGLDGNLRSKLVTESIAPWRTIRLFLYGALGTGAFVGGLINTSGAIAASNSPDFNLQTEVCLGRRRSNDSEVIVMLHPC